MATKRLYSRSPIMEAVIDIQVALPSDVSLETLDAFVDLEKPRYPIRQKRVKVVSEITVDGQAVPTGTQMIDGHVLTSEDKKQIVQARLDGFTFSRLSPYEKWELFREEAHRLWLAYYSVAQPTQLNRLAVRYVNRLDIPLPFDDFKDFLMSYPEISSGLPQTLSNFFLQFHIPQEDGATLIVNEAILPPSDPTSVPESISILLDLDLFRVYSSPISEPMSNIEIWNTLDWFHERVEQAFEASITDRMRELII